MMNETEFKQIEITAWEKLKSCTDEKYRPVFIALLKANKSLKDKKIISDFVKNEK